MPIKWSNVKTESLLFDEDLSIHDQTYQDFIKAFLSAFHKHITECELTRNITFCLTERINGENIEIYNNIKKWFLKLIPNGSLLEIVDDPSINVKEFGVPAIPLHLLGGFNNRLAINDVVYVDPQVETNEGDFLVAGTGARLRALGILFYKSGIGGFLNFGLNYTRCTNDVVNLSDRYPTGTYSLFYSSANGPIPSIRLKLFHSALQDLRALETLERLSSRKEVLALINKYFPTDSTSDAQKLLAFRSLVNRLIYEHFSKENI